MASQYFLQAIITSQYCQEIKLFEKLTSLQTMSERQSRTLFRRLVAILIKSITDQFTSALHFTQEFFKLILNILEIKI